MSQFAPGIRPLPCTPGDAVGKWGVHKDRKVRSSFSLENLSAFQKGYLYVLQMELRNLGMEALGGPCPDPGAACPCHSPTVSPHTGRSLGLPQLEKSVLALLGKAG